ncbi:hypothetical protein B5G34_17890 [Flavonifractor sp. An82]|uniref:hypothetical protein n=1 Tax=Flavonifractor sp. An82 TaxID=1965660 RepID=UPI000B379BCE|nr:hypothetical protein [Flavonifractor sp. An82]OUN18830.1 hypothetical protein B5G34_17890 [Flavonifractor sp. An82]
MDNRYEYVKALCWDYWTQKSGELITISKEDVAREQTDGGPWPASYLESLAVYRAICERLVARDVVLFHCSALAYRQRGYLFAAPSGTGKSTHTRLWREVLGDAVRMINDDKPLLKVTSEGVTVYGTPFAGKEGLQENSSAPVAGIVLLHQAEANHIRRLSPREAYPMLLNQTYRPKDGAGLMKTLELVQRLSQLPVYSMGCTISREVVALAVQNLTGQELPS